MAKTYKELKDNFFEEVGNIDVSKLGLGFGGLKDYAELLKFMAEMPDESKEDQYKNTLNQCCTLGFSGFGVPRKSEQEVK